MTAAMTQVPVPTAIIKKPEVVASGFLLGDVVV